MKWLALEQPLLSLAQSVASAVALGTSLDQVKQALVRGVFLERELSDLSAMLRRSQLSEAFLTQGTKVEDEDELRSWVHESVPTLLGATRARLDLDPMATTMGPDALQDLPVRVLLLLPQRSMRSAPNNLRRPSMNAQRTLLPALRVSRFSTTPYLVSFVSSIVQRHVPECLFGTISILALTC